MSKKTIIIQPCESMTALLAAITNALAAEFEVAEKSDGRVCPFADSEVGFDVQSAAASVTLGVKNAHGQVQKTSSSVTFAAESVYALDVYRSVSGTATAVTLRINENKILPSVVIAKNADADCVGLVLSSNTMLFIRGNESKAAKSCVSVKPYSSNLPAFSLVKMPDIYSGSVFEEIYLIFSAPVNITEGMSIHAGGKDFVPISAGSTYGSWAMPF